MEAERVREGGWLRPAGLLATAVLLAIGQPLVVVTIAFAMLAFLAPGARHLIRLLAAVALGLAFAGEPQGGFWYLERGWAVIVAGAFVALTLSAPDRTFLVRAMLSVGAGAIAVGGAALLFDGWPQIEWLITQRVEQGVSSSLQMLAVLGAGEAEAGLRETLTLAGRVQGVLFPALAALSTLAALGVAWWLHAKLGAEAGGALGSLREFRFHDALIWAFIAGLILLLMAEWDMGWGRVGMNLVAFMGALYLVRGVGVLLFLSGGVKLAGGVLIAVAVLVAGPVLAFGAMLIGVGDSWVDLRSRLDGTRGAEGG